MNEIILGDCLEVMRSFPDNHFSAIVTDPPYGLHFMGKDWDKYGKIKCHNRYDRPNVKCNVSSYEAGTYDPKRDDEFQSFMYQIATESLRITKPGGHVVMFGAPRRYHRQVCAVEDAGWEIRDCLMWLFGSGFPKSHNHFGIEGYGTALKPAYEPIILAMKPLEGTFKENAERWGQAGINIDGCRIPTSENTGRPKGPDGNCFGHYNAITTETHPKGRWPANVILDEEAAAMLDEQSGVSKPKSQRKGIKGGSGFGYFDDNKTASMSGVWPGDNGGGASRFFYCAKTSSRERNEGLEEFPDKNQTPYSEMKGTERHSSNRQSTVKNNHPTVKPLALMRYLITLVSSPTNAIILDPFAGSGSTILAAKQLGISAIGIEKQPEYAEIARARVNFYQPEAKESEQMEMFA